MSGLSLSDMRRLGAEKNAENAKQGTLPVANTLPQIAASLPFLKDKNQQTGTETSEPEANKPDDGTTSAAGIKRPANPADQTGAPSALEKHGAATRTAHPHKILRRSLTRHMFAGSMAGSVVGLCAATLGGMAMGNLAMSTMGVGTLLGAAGGAGWGRHVGQSAHSVDWQSRRTFAISQSKSGGLYDAFEHACRLAALEPPRWTIDMDTTAAIAIDWAAGQKASATIGWPLLACLSAEQIAIVVAHALACMSGQGGAAQEWEQEQDALSLLQVHSLSLSAQSGSVWSRLERSDALTAAHDTALRQWVAERKHLARHADTLIARTAGPRALTEALLAQGLVAGLLDFLIEADANPKGCEPAACQLVETAAQGITAPELDRALHLIAATPEPTPRQWLFGMPFDLLERLTSFDTSNLAVPALPARETAWLAITPKERIKAARRLSKPDKRTTGKARPEKIQSSQAPERWTHRQSETRKGNAKATRTGGGLLGLLTRKIRPSAAPLDEMDLGQAPLYRADALFQSDTVEGLSAYQTLVDAYPRWALARLRLAEAQIECGISAGVGNLKLCVEMLPSALPSILDRLQSALPMVSPLEEEPIRQIVSKLHGNAAVVAAERAEIDLDKLTPSHLDTIDEQTLASLFERTPGLREVWALSAPCAHMPDVPHHALLGLAPRVSTEAAQHMALTLAEHAAIRGTVAVYIETGKPAGALGDVMAAQSSLWRVGASRKTSKLKVKV